MYLLAPHSILKYTCNMDSLIWANYHIQYFMYLSILQEYHSNMPWMEFSRIQCTHCPPAKQDAPNKKGHGVGGKRWLLSHHHEGGGQKGGKSSEEKPKKHWSRLSPQERPRQLRLQQQDSSSISGSKHLLWFRSLKQLSGCLRVPTSVGKIAKQEKKVRLLAHAEKKAAGKGDVLLAGVNMVSNLVEKKKALLLVIAHKVDPSELVASCLPCLTRWGSPTVSPKRSPGWGGWSSGNRGPLLSSQDKIAPPAKMVDPIRTNYNDRYNETHHH